MATVTKPIALDETFHTTELTPRNLADVLAQALQILNTTISGLNFINCVVVQTLPTTGISTTTIYLVPSDDPQSENIYDEYINLDGTSAGWEKIGSTKIDLSNYYTKAETDTLLSAKADTSDIPTVNDGTLTIQQNGETKGTFTANQSGNSTVNIETPTTDIQTAVDEFETYNGGLLSECKVTLEPIQDLHGYNHPWVGGAGKNKLPNTVTSTTINGVTFTVHSDGTVTVNGTATNITAVAYEIIALNGTYILNGCPSGGGSGTYELQAVTTITNRDYGNGVTFTINGDCLVQILIRQGTTLNNAVFKPMIRLATESDPTFEPYENICPISGHTQVDVDVSDGQTTQEQVTVNLGGTYYSGVLDVVSGELTVDSAFIASYNGETLPSTWISDRDVYAVGTAPTTGAEVCYTLATPLTIQLSPTTVKALVGENHLSAPLEGQEITESKYKQMFTFDDVIAYIQSLS